MTWAISATVSISDVQHVKFSPKSVLPLFAIQTRAFIGRPCDPFMGNLGSEILEDVENWVCLRK